MTVTIRTALPPDFDVLGQIMFTAIRVGDSPYTEAERAAWMPEPNAGEAWAERLSQQRVWVAQKSGRPVGFMTLGSGGYIDLAYILPDARGQGVFKRLFQALEDAARARGLEQLTTHASLMAQGPFSNQGFTVDHYETVERHGQHLRRAKMSKVLPKRSDQALVRI